MFTLFYGLWKFWFKKDEFFVLILGLDNAGKSTFLEQAKIQFNPKNRAVSLKSITTTVGLNIGKLQTDGVVINFWDLGGQRELQALWDKVSFFIENISKCLIYTSLPTHTHAQYYAEAHGIIYIIDSSDRDRVDESRAAFGKPSSCICIRFFVDSIVKTVFFYRYRIDDQESQVIPNSSSTGCQ